GLSDQPEPVGAQQDNIVPAVFELLDADQLANATDIEQRSPIVVIEPMRLDHRDPPRTVDRVADHLAIARLEDVQRKLRTREQDRSGQGEDWNAQRAAHVNRTAERRRRWLLDQESSSPCASSSWRKRWRAAPSFHSRSRAMISSKASAAESRSPAAIFALASSKRASWSSGFDSSRFSSADVSAAGEAVATSSAARARVISGFLASSPRMASMIWRASAVSPLAISARASPPITAGSSGAISWT